MTFGDWLLAVGGVVVFLAILGIFLGWLEERKAGRPAVFQHEPLGMPTPSITKGRSRNLFRCSCCGREISPPFFPDEVVICKTCNPAKWERDRRRYNDMRRGDDD